MYCTHVWVAVLYCWLCYGTFWLRFWEIWKWFLPFLRQTHQSVFSLAAAAASVPGLQPTWYQQTFNHHHPKLRLISKPWELWLDLIKRDVLNTCVFACAFPDICEHLRTNCQLWHVLTSEKLFFHMLSHLIIVGPMVFVGSDPGQRFPITQLSCEFWIMKCMHYLGYSFWGQWLSWCVQNQCERITSRKLDWASVNNRCSSVTDFAEMPLDKDLLLTTISSSCFCLRAENCKPDFPPHVATWTWQKILLWETVQKSTSLIKRWPVAKASPQWVIAITSVTLLSGFTMLLSNCVYLWEKLQ